MQHVGFMGQAPHYLPDSENPAAIESLVTYVARLLNLSPDMSTSPRPSRTSVPSAIKRWLGTAPPESTCGSWSRSTTRRSARSSRHCLAESWTRTG